MASSAVDQVERSTRAEAGRRSDLILIALFWSLAFGLGSVRGTLANEIPFPLIAPHRFAVMLFGALLCWAMVHLFETVHLRRFRDRAFVGLAAAPALAALQSLFHLASCRVVPIDGFAPISPVEALNAGMISVGHFVAWVALHLALRTHREAEIDRRRAAARAESRPPPPERSERSFWASRGRQTVRIASSGIVWAEAQRDYVLLHAPAGGGMVRETLASVQEALGDDDFIRVHRSALVRRSAISAIRRKPSGALAVILNSGEEVPAGRRYAPGVRSLLAQLGG